jgi:hypothetical protein
MKLRTILAALPASLSPGLVAAVEQSGQWSSVAGTLQSIIANVGAFLDFTQLSNSSSVVRAAFFLLIFIVLYAAGIRAFGQITNERSEGKEGTWAAITAFLIAMITVIVTPEGLIMTFASQFGLFFWVALFFILYGVVLWFMYVFLPGWASTQTDDVVLTDNRARLLGGARAIICLLALSMLQSFQSSFIRVTSDPALQYNPGVITSILNTLNGMILVVFSVLLVIEITRLFTGFGSDESDDTESLFAPTEDGNGESSLRSRTRSLANSDLERDSQTPTRQDSRGSNGDESTESEEIGEELEDVADDDEYVEDQLMEANQSAAELASLVESIQDAAEAEQWDTVASLADEGVDLIEGGQS